jgi:hypothetical protein
MLRRFGTKTRSAFQGRRTQSPRNGIIRESYGARSQTASQTDNPFTLRPLEAIEFWRQNTKAPDIARRASRRIGVLAPRHAYATKLQNGNGTTLKGYNTAAFWRQNT